MCALSDKCWQACTPACWLLQLANVQPGEFQQYSQAVVGIMRIQKASDKIGEVCCVVQVQNSCFFKGLEQASPSMLIANPPYIAAPDDDILMPALHGGIDGAVLTRVKMQTLIELAEKCLTTSIDLPCESFGVAPLACRSH